MVLYTMSHVPFFPHFWYCHKDVIIYMFYSFLFFIQMSKKIYRIRMINRMLPSLHAIRMMHRICLAEPRPSLMVSTSKDNIFFKTNNFYYILYNKGQYYILEIINSKYQFCNKIVWKIIYWHNWYSFLYKLFYLASFQWGSLF